jgi:hypothetical protein
MADGTGGNGAALTLRAGEAMTGAGEVNVLGHLLKIEADAAAMVDDAQAEADRRVAESEKQNRARYDEEYGRQAAELDRAFDDEVARIRADYQAQLDAYRGSLDSIPADQGRFSALMDELLTGGGTRGRREGRRI